jgi:subtilisin family serine protease
MVDSNWWLSERTRRSSSGTWDQPKTIDLDSTSGGISFVAGEFIAHPTDLARTGALASAATRILPETTRAHDWLVNGLELYAYGAGDLPAYVERLRIAARVDGVVRPRIGLHYVLTGEIKAIIPRGGPATPPWPVVLTDPTGLTPTDWGGHDAPSVAVLDTGLDADSPQAQPTDDPIVVHDRGTPAKPEPDDIDVLHEPAVQGGPAPTLAVEAGHGTFITALVERLAKGGVRLRSVRVLNPDGVGTERTIIKGLQRLRSHFPEPTVRVINLSLGGFTDDGGWPGADPNLPAELKDQMPVALEAELAVWAAQYPGTVFVCAAGNDGQDRKFWPAAASEGSGGPGPDPVVIAVGSLDARGARSWFSNGGTWVTVWALGEDIVSEYPKGEFATTPAFVEQFPQRLARWSGTSFAAPLVTAEIARLAKGKQGDGAAVDAWHQLRASLVRRDPANSTSNLEYDPRSLGPQIDPRVE